MTWFDLINKRKKGRRTSERSIEYVNNLMADGKKRSVNEILDELFEEKDKESNFMQTTEYIPTRKELIMYLGSSRKYGLDMPEYSSGYFDRDTDVPSRKGSINAVIKFWLKK